MLLKIIKYLHFQVKPSKKTAWALEDEVTTVIQNMGSCLPLDVLLVTRRLKSCLQQTVTGPQMASVWHSHYPNSQLSISISIMKLCLLM